MKHTLTLLVLLFIPFVCFGQDFDFNDLKVINSEKQFKRFCFENEFVKTGDSDAGRIIYAKGYNKLAETATVWAIYYAATGIFIFQIPKYYDGSSNVSFNRVLQQVKKQCTFYDFKESTSFELKKEFICYTCPGSAYPGKIGFARTEENDFIELFTNFN